MKTAIVAPCHIQPSDAWVAALEAERAATQVDIIIVDDSDGAVTYPAAWDVYGYKKQELMLGPERYELFKQFQHSSACKQFGLWVAYQLGYYYVIVIDSDCLIPVGFTDAHISALNTTGAGWANPLRGTGWYSRGFPYKKRDLPKWAHMGLWDSELDLYGADRVISPDGNTNDLPWDTRDIQDAQFFPLSGMNVSFVRDAIPFMLFLPNFTSGQYKFSRHDDIWGGYIFQKVAELKGRGLSYGSPIVVHDTVVHSDEDAAEEVAMIQHENNYYSLINEYFEDKEYVPSAFSLFLDLADEVETTDFDGLRGAFTLQSTLYG